MEGFVSHAHHLSRTGHITFCSRDTAASAQRVVSYLHNTFSELVKMR